MDLLGTEGKELEQKKQYKLNLPADVKRWVAEQAAKNLRSQSSEIILALKEKMERSVASTGQTLGS